MPRIVTIWHQNLESTWYAIMKQPHDWTRTEKTSCAKLKVVWLGLKIGFALKIEEEKIGLRRLMGKKMWKYNLS